MESAILKHAIADLETSLAELEVKRLRIETEIEETFKGKTISFMSDYDSYESFVIEDARVKINNNREVDVVLYPKSKSEFKEVEIQAFNAKDNGELVWVYEVTDKRFWSTDRYKTEELTIEAT